MKNRKLTPVATRPGYAVVESVDAIDGGQCLVVDGIRVAGAEPTLARNNIRYRWNVSEENLHKVISPPSEPKETP